MNMQKIFLLILLVFTIIESMGQSQGIRYQAVLIDENEKEIPGIDVEGNYLPNQELTIRFTILDENEAIDYQEEHQTLTDDYGMINVTIGLGSTTTESPGEFTDIDWDGTPKSLSVEIMLSGISPEFAEFSSEELKFVPYAYHRNITATGTMIIDGTTDLNSDLTVNNSSPTYLTGSLTVDETTDLNSDLNINNGSPANLSGSLTVDGISNLNNELNVNNASPTNLSGSLNVDAATNLNDELNVNNGSQAHFSGDVTVLGESTLANVNLTTLNSVSNQESFVATFENTNGNTGDGIKIKLGKTAAKNNNSATILENEVKEYFGEVTTAEFNSIAGILDGNLSVTDLGYLTSLAVPTNPEEAAQEALALTATVCELTTLVGNQLIEHLSSALSLSTPEVDLGIVTIPSLSIDIDIPGIPTNLCSALGNGYDLPHVAVSDITGTNPLDYENRFIEFTDNEDFTMGAIKAESIENWAHRYINPAFIFELIVAFKGLDKILVMPKVKAIGAEIAKSYLAIGVSYSSGNGDYAEWLERLDSTERISTGDIVGVIGGKITKDLTDAQQVMAISSHPIVLGNAPKINEEHLGNNVAFMGQIPVKIMGPVKSGDYIVGKGEIPGYGVAINPENMTLDDFKNSVGRSWENNTSSGPKMVNTVIGMHNGNYLNILKKYEERITKSENRLKNIEEKLDLILKKDSTLLN